jgi:hypothetical protein
MSMVLLDEYRVTDPRAWLLSALGAAAAVVKVWDAVRVGVSPKLALAATVLMVLVLIVARGLRRKSELVPETKTVRVTTSVFGRQVSIRELDVSKAAWVRARPIADKTQLVVELGTAGYTTKELVRVSMAQSQGISIAEDLCARIALHLNIADKGYKPMS